MEKSIKIPILVARYLQFTKIGDTHVEMSNRFNLPLHSLYCTMPAKDR